MISEHSSSKPPWVRHHDAAAQEVTALFIGGVGRSGTTILELSLGTDPRVVSLGEVVHLWERCLLADELCGCGAPFSECPFWTAVGERAFGGWSAVDARRVMDLKRRIDRTLRTPQVVLSLGGLTYRNEVREYASYYERLYAAAADVSGATVVVDSSKQASLPHILRKVTSLNLKVLHCVRDSRAVAYSWTKVVQRPEAQGEAASLMTRYSPGVLALKWLLHNGVIEFLRLLRVPTMRLRYEDWAKRPHAAFHQVLQFAGLNHQPNAHIGADWIDLPAAHTCSGNPMRFRTGRVHVRRDEQWKQQLPRSSRQLVTALTTPLLTVYGYWRTRP